MSIFGQRLRELRLNKKIMVKDMAKLLNITPRNYQRYENGKVDPPTSKTIFLANYFNVPTDYLLCTDELSKSLNALEEIVNRGLIGNINFIETLIEYLRDVSNGKYTPEEIQNKIKEFEIILKFLRSENMDNSK